MLESLLSMFPALAINVVTQTLQACNYIMRDVSNNCFCLGLFPGDVMLAWAEPTRGLC